MPDFLQNVLVGVAAVATLIYAGSYLAAAFGWEVRKHWRRWERQEREKEAAR